MLTAYLRYTVRIKPIVAKDGRLLRFGGAPHLASPSPEIQSHFRTSLCERVTPNNHADEHTSRTTLQPLSGTPRARSAAESGVRSCSRTTSAFSRTCGAFLQAWNDRELSIVPPLLPLNSDLQGTGTIYSFIAPREGPVLLYELSFEFLNLNLNLHCCLAPSVSSVFPPHAAPHSDPDAANAQHERGQPLSYRHPPL